jgi:hypothetical protein
VLPRQAPNFMQEYALSSPQEFERAICAIAQLSLREFQGNTFKLQGPVELFRFQTVNELFERLMRGESPVREQKDGIKSEFIEGLFQASALLQRMGADEQVSGRVAKVAHLALRNSACLQLMLLRDAGEPMAIEALEIYNRHVVSGNEELTRETFLGVIHNTLENSHSGYAKVLAELLKLYPLS